MQGETHRCVYLQRGLEGSTAELGSRDALALLQSQVPCFEGATHALKANLQVPVPQRLSTDGRPIRYCRIRPSGLILCFLEMSALAARWGDPSRSVLLRSVFAGLEWSGKKCHSEFPRDYFSGKEDGKCFPDRLFFVTRAPSLGASGKRSSLPALGLAERVASLGTNQRRGQVLAWLHFCCAGAEWLLAPARRNDTGGRRGTGAERYRLPATAG